MIGSRWSRKTQVCAGRLWPSIVVSVVLLVVGLVMHDIADGAVSSWWTWGLVAGLALACLLAFILERVARTRVTDHLYYYWIGARVAEPHAQRLTRADVSGLLGELHDFELDVARRGGTEVRVTGPLCSPSLMKRLAYRQVRSNSIKRHIRKAALLLFHSRTSAVRRLRHFDVSWTKSIPSHG